ncbi:MAG: hypothetical protein AABY14_00430, partial [Nanoarchaeota archaeon]
MSDFEEYFKIPHQTMKSRLYDFVRNKIIIEGKKARFVYYSLNLTNPLTKEYISLCEKERTLDFLDKNTVFLRIYSHLSKHFNNNKILIFGSAITEKKYNDIDLLIISRDNTIKKTIKQFEETYTLKIHTTITEEKYLQASLINEIRKKHIILNEHDYFVKVIYKNELG